MAVTFATLFFAVVFVEVPAFFAVAVFVVLEDTVFAESFFEPDLEAVFFTTADVFFSVFTPIALYYTPVMKFSLP